LFLALFLSLPDGQVSGFGVRDPGRMSPGRDTHPNAFRRRTLNIKTATGAGSLDPRRRRPPSKRLFGRFFCANRTLVMEIRTAIR